MWLFRKRVVRRKRRTRTRRKSVHYETHRELARLIITERVAALSERYQFSYNRIFIKNQKRCWGSCSAQGNLNFNYRLIFLPEALMEYVIAHELCHLKELNHSKEFWVEVARIVPEYRALKQQLRTMTQIPPHGFPGSMVYIRRTQAV